MPSSQPILAETRTTLRWCVLLVAVASCALYLATVGSEFVYDDIPQVVNNPWIRDFARLPNFFSGSVWAFAGIENNYYRPLMLVSYLVSYHLFGLNPWGFHLVNTLLFAANAVLVFLVSRGVFARALPQRRGDLLPALAAGLLYAAHPVHSEAVAWIGGFPDLCYSFFCLLSLLFYLKSDEGDSAQMPLVVLAAASFFLATLSKEPALTFPAVLAAYDVTVNRRRRPLGEWVKRYLPFVAVIGAYVALRLWALAGFSPVLRHEGLTPGQMLINVASLFAGYLGTLALPARLTVWHPFAPLTSLSQVPALTAVAVSIAFVALLGWLGWRRSYLFFFLIVFLVPLLPALYLPGLGENPFAERYLFLPSVGFALMSADLLLRLGERFRQAVLPLLLLVLLCYGAATALRLPAWKNDLALWSDAVQKSPESPLPHYNRAVALADRGRLAEAVGEYRAAIALQPAAVAYKSLGATYARMGRGDLAIEQYRLALELEPNDPATHNELGSYYAETGHLPEAIREFGAAVQLRPDLAIAHYNLGLALKDSGRLEQARAEFEIAARLNPQDPSYRAALSAAGAGSR